MRWLLVGSILFAAVSVFAGKGANYYDQAYEDELLARALPESEQSFCSPKKGSRTACKVTRLYLSDIAEKKEKGFPPQADIDYVKSRAEEDALIDRLPPVK